MSVKAATFLLFVLTTISIANSYVLEKVRKGDNQSNVNALIHKVIPSEKFEEIASTARKQSSNYRKYKVKKDEENNELESIMFAIKSPIKNEQSNRKGDIAQSFVDFIKYYIVDNSIHFRKTLQKYNIKPEVVNFNSGKPSLLYKINMQGVVDSMRNFFDWDKFKKHSEDIVRKAAELFRRFKDKIAKRP